MNCPYCNKDIYALTGFQELQKYQKHLRKCKKRPITNRPINLLTAAEDRIVSEEMREPRSTN